MELSWFYEGAWYAAIGTVAVFVFAMCLRVYILFAYPSGDLLFGDDFEFLLTQYRICWFGGRVRGGKTSLCYYLAYRLLKSGDYRFLISNVPDCWRASKNDLHLREGQYLDAVIILDEGGQYLKRSDSGDTFVFGQGKLNNVVLIPSVVPPSSSICNLTVQFSYDLSALGVPISIYKWMLRSQFNKEKGWFLWVNPWAIYGVFDTLAPVLSDSGISGLITTVVEFLLKEKGLDKEFYEGFSALRRGVSSSANLMDMSALENVSRSLEEFGDAVTKAKRR